MKFDAVVSQVSLTAFQLSTKLRYLTDFDSQIIYARKMSQTRKKEDQVELTDTKRKEKRASAYLSRLKNKCNFR